jgi:hypothetical protein
MQKTPNFFKGVVAIWIAWMLFCLLIVIGLIVTAIHFIAKVW